MMTLTIRHTGGMNLRELRRGLSRSWRRFQQSKTWRKVRSQCGVRHMIRAHEVTHGENGWHPHLHVMVFACKPYAFAARKAALFKEWRRCVKRELGKRCAPSKRRGLAMHTCDDGRYLAKMGLELAHAVTKEGHEDHLTPWQIAERIEAGTIDPQLWQEYAQAMLGAHQLQWSRGLKDAFGVPQPDSMICGEEADDPFGAVIIAEIPRETWKQMTSARGALLALYARGQGATDPPDVARTWIRTFFEATCGNGEAAHWIQTMAGTRALRWIRTHTAREETA